MDIILAKIIATALVFSQVATAPSQLRTKFDETHDQAVVTELLRTGFAHMRKAFDVEDLNLDDLIATAMEDASLGSAGDGGRLVEPHPHAREIGLERNFNRVRVHWQHLLEAPHTLAVQGKSSGS